MSDVIFEFELAWVKKELEKTDKIIKELGQELGEVFNQSSETDHDNAPADVIKDKAGAYWQRRSWLLGLQSLKRAPMPTTYDVVQHGHKVDLKSPQGKSLYVQLGNITQATSERTTITKEAPVYKDFLGMRLGGVVRIADTIYTVDKIH